MSRIFSKIAVAILLIVFLALILFSVVYLPINYNRDHKEARIWLNRQELVLYKIHPGDNWEGFFYFAPENISKAYLTDELQEISVKKGCSAWDTYNNLVVGDQMYVPKSFVKSRE